MYLRSTRHIFTLLCSVTIVALLPACQQADSRHSANADDYSTHLETVLMDSGMLLLLFVLTLAVVIGSSFYIIMLYRRRIAMMEKRQSYLWNSLEKEKKKESEMEKKLKILLDSQSEIATSEVQTLNLVSKKNIQLFQKRFELLYPDFLNNVHARAGKLSTHDDVLCMLIAIGKESTQIEKILGIAHRSVIVSRYRLKQKLNIENNGNMDDFIKDLLRKDNEPEKSDAEKEFINIAID